MAARVMVMVRRVAGEQQQQGRRQLGCWASNGNEGDCNHSNSLDWEFRLLVPISGTPTGDGIPIPFTIPKIPVGFYF